MFATAKRLYGEARINPQSLKWEWALSLDLTTNSMVGDTGRRDIRSAALDDLLLTAVHNPRIFSHLWNSEIKAIVDLINVQWRTPIKASSDVRFEITPFNNLCSVLNFESRGVMIGHPWFPTYPNFMYCYDVNNQGPGSFSTSAQIPIVKRPFPSDDPDVDLLDFITI